MDKLSTFMDKLSTFMDKLSTFMDANHSKTYYIRRACACAQSFFRLISEFFRGDGSVDQSLRPKDIF